MGTDGVTSSENRYCSIDRPANPSAMLDQDACYAQLQRRDPTADGVFFVAVSSTGIYCRPICPARIPLRRNVTFYAAAAAAQAAGYRPCLRCRPESAPYSPAWVGSLSSINRALRLIDEGFLSDGSVEALADALGMTSRHLRRLFVKHIGVGPINVEQTRRINLAKKLLHETNLPVTDVAFAAGFGSIRRFNEVFRAMFNRAPSSLRRNTRFCEGSMPVTLSVATSVLASSPVLLHQRTLSLPGLAPNASAMVSPATGRTYAVTFTNVPIGQIGWAIALIRRLLAEGLKSEGHPSLIEDPFAHAA